MELTDGESNETHTITARAIVNAAGPWTLDALKKCNGAAQGKQLRLVKGSHLVVKRLYEGDHAYILQNDDGRIVFVIPFHDDFTLIGTTEVVLDAPPTLGGERLDISNDEADYLCTSVNGYLTEPISPKDKVWSFAGIRPLFDDATANASAITREYVLDLDVQDDTPLLSVFGGKLTTYRQLAEKVLEKIKPFFPEMDKPWTHDTALPGGDVEHDFLGHLRHVYAGIDDQVLRGLARRHGELAHQVLAGAETMADLGEHFGAGLTAREVDYMIEHEWACTADDILWRRTKHGLKLNEEQCSALAAYIEGQR